MINEKETRAEGEIGSSVESICRPDIDLLPQGNFGTLIVGELNVFLLYDGEVVAKAWRIRNVPEKFKIANFGEGINVTHPEQWLFFPTRKNGWMRIDKDITRDELVSIAAKHGYDYFRNIVFISISYYGDNGEYKKSYSLEYYDLHPYLTLPY